MAITVVSVDLDHDLINVSFGSNLNQQVEASFALSHFERYPAAFTYDTNTGEIIDWGHSAEENCEALESYTDNDNAEKVLQSSHAFHRSILAEIYRLYKSQDENKETDHQDEMRSKAIGRFLGAVCKHAYENSVNQLSNSHFLFILPTEWDHSIRTQFIPRLFQYGGITSTEDPESRIMFTSVLESTVAAMQEERYFEEYGIQFLREKKYLHCDLYMDDLELPTELVLQAFQVEDEQTLIDSTAIFEQTNRLLIPKLANTFSQNAVRFSSCKGVALDFKRNAKFLMEGVSDGWKKRLQSCLDEITSFDEQKFDETSTDRTSTVSKNLSNATLIRSTCADRETIASSIENYLNRNNHRQIDSITITLHDSLPQPKKKLLDLYIYCIMDSLKHFQHTNIRILGESRWASPKFGGPEIIRGGLFKLLESLKFANIEGSPSIKNIHEEDAESHLDAEVVRPDSPFICGHRGCGWAFVHPHDTEVHRLLYHNAKLNTLIATFWNPRRPLKQGDKHSLFLFIDVTIESTHLSLSLFDKQYKIHRKINLADSCLLGLPPLSHFISLYPEENGKMALNAEKIFFDLVNSLYHQAFHKFCNDNDNGETDIHNLGAFSSKFTVDHYYQYFADSDLVWSFEEKNMEQVSELEEFFYHNKSGKSNEHTSTDPIHVNTFILLYIGYVYHKMNMIIVNQQRKVLQDIDLHPEEKAMLVLEDLLLNVLPLNAHNNPELTLRLCGFRGKKSSEIFSSKGDFSLSMLQQSLLLKNSEPSTRSYYSHAKISEDNIDFELNQIIQSTTANNIKMMPLLLKQYRIKIDQTNNSISQRMWAYIRKKQENQPQKVVPLHSMNEETYSSFKSSIANFISKILRFLKHAQNSKSELASFYDRSYGFEYHLDHERIALSLREIVEVAVRPFMRNIAASILSVFRNMDAFALYNTETLLNFSLFHFEKGAPGATEEQQFEYGYKFNFAKDLFVEDDNDEQQTVLECSNKDYARIPANYLYVLLTQRTKLRQFSRYFKTEVDNAIDLDSIELVKFEESGQDGANPGDSILAVSVSYTTVHRFELESMPDLKPQDFPLILVVTPLNYLSLLEVSVKMGKNEKYASHRLMLPSLLREKQTLSYENAP
ncbi:hypothetical protein MAM1_0087c04781 [Mucor ambiguus]|uniref:C2H2-type domain-containing protein n=1 Tax=Mucor ambiguus TaxID=91626 RepID=A0A0C9M6B6_9FUNG|nr:hypothetical protein MAM1_0087c04781 [Mucor ambiguus]